MSTAQAAASRRGPVPAAGPRGCNCSALAELGDYVSDRLPSLEPQGAQPVFSARAGRLLLRGTRVEAEVGPFTLGSISQRIVPADAPSRTVAWSSNLVARSPSGQRITAETLIRLQTTDAGAVAMDRLFRVLHMLNHLACAREEEALWLPVSLRHLAGVVRDHGAFFEEVLRQCGLGPERIVLVLQLPVADSEASAHVVAAVERYRLRGFRDEQHNPGGAT